MIKKLNEYLIMNYPRIWNSMILYIFIFSISTFLFFFLFIDYFDTETDDLIPDKWGNTYERDDEKFGYPPLFLWTTFVFAWLYFQYQHTPFFKTYSFFEIFKVSLLNLVCISLILIPLYPLFEHTIDDPNKLRYVFNLFYLEVYILFIPFIFLPFIIKSYSITDILLTIIAVVFYSIVITLIILGARLDDSIFIIVGLLHYVGILIYVIYKLGTRKYNKLDKLLIFVLVCLAPWFVSFLSYFVKPANGNNTRIIPDLQYTENEAYYYICMFCTFLFLLILTWFVTKSLKKPIVIR